MGNVERKKRQLTANDSCSLCNLQQGDIFHVLQDCSHARSVWNLFGAFSVWNEFFRVQDLQRWLLSNLKFFQHKWMESLEM